MSVLPNPCGSFGCSATAKWSGLCERHYRETFGRDLDEAIVSAGPINAAALVSDGSFTYGALKRAEEWIDANEVRIKAGAKAHAAASLAKLLTSWRAGVDETAGEPTR